MNGDSRLRGPERRLLRGYGPLLAMTAAFALMVTLVPTIAREQTVIHDAGATGGGVSTTAPGTGAVVPGAPATGPSTTTGSGGTSVTRRVAAGHTSGCTDRHQQVPGDPYSPPCVLFSGDNGGATSRGVSKDTITIAMRLTADPDLSSTIAKIAGSDLIDSNEDAMRTAQGLVDYFNSRFQFYGRKIKLVPFQGHGALTRELLGAGQEQANADAIKVASEVGAFGDVTGFSEPYSDALARQKVLAFGAPYMSRQWFLDRRPYAWSSFTDCSLVAQSNSDWFNKRIAGRPAKYAGGDLANKTRKIGIVVPDNPEYQQCLHDGLNQLHAAGNDAFTVNYSLDLASLSNQAASIVAKLKAAGVTSVACACDPILPVFLTAKAHEQSYYPEWLVQGTAFTDTDVAGQLYDQTEWAHAFGISTLGTQLPERAGLGYNAYKAVRGDEPAHSVELIYYQLYMLAMGIELAGPTLTPLNFERGMFSYPGGTGEAGTWGFGPGHYTPTQDYKEIWWDPNRTSSYNDKQGAYATSGQRYRLGQVPAGDPPVFR
ncbi:MAG TPA: hypothetical protein VH134_01575 [Candidatus Dormibacteraeota bacterium]|nr:hypothetical protein [Candidatus Dormibacteraeota bacterium]